MGACVAACCAAVLSASLLDMSACWFECEWEARAALHVAYARVYTGIMHHVY